jgi:hypothetical protein
MLNLEIIKLNWYVDSIYIIKTITKVLLYFSIDIPFVDSDIMVILFWYV